MKKRPLSELAALLNAPCSEEGIIEGFAVDSRSLKPSDVFFALTGERVDGHRFLRDVAEKQALAAVVSKDFQGESYGLPLLRVDNVLQALQYVAKVVISRRQSKVIAVTGSVGKTTTKEFIATLLGGKFRVVKTPGNSNSQVGIPLSILDSEGDEEIFVMEMGMSQPNELQKLVEIAPPHIAIITKVALAHSEFFPEGIEGIAQAKTEIFSHHKTQLGIVNAQICQFETALKTGSCPKLVFSIEDTAAEVDFSLRIEKGGMRIKEKGDESPLFMLPFSATHLCENFTCASAVARTLGMTWDEIIERIPLLKVYKRRFEKIERSGVVFINDSYNASPASMGAALTNLPEPREGGRRVAVLGEMKELGKFSEKSHREIGELAFTQVDHLLCLGKGCQPMVDVFSKGGKAVNWFEDLTQLRETLFSFIKTGDVVLIKGSNSNQMWRILDDSEEHL